MRRYDFRAELAAAVPEVPLVFSRAVRDTLAELARCERKEEETVPMKNVINKRRTLTVVLAAVLVVATVATAATLLSRNVFDVTMGDIPDNAATLVQHDLAQETIGDAEITIKEAAYDGMALYIAYSIRDLTATEPWGEVDKKTGERRLTAEDYQRIRKMGVGWWNDNLWIDGKQVGMPQMSGGDELPGEENGEAMFYMMYRLDQEGVFLDGKDVEIAMPIGAQQPLDTLKITQEPFDIEKPDKGLVAFRMDCSSRDQVATETPDVLMEGPKWSATVSQVVYSPIQMYVTLEWEVKPEVLAAYIAENGDGYYENGVKLYDYDGLEASGSEIMHLQLVDKDGKPVFEAMEGFYGCSGANATQAWYTFPYAEEYPETMFLAPEVDGAVDMTQAVQVK